MVNLDDIVSSFEFINVVPSDAVLVKCNELCVRYDIDAEELVNYWCAFAASTVCTDGPTVEKLEIMARKIPIRKTNHKEEKMVESCSTEVQDVVRTPERPQPTKTVSSVVKNETQEVTKTKVDDGILNESIKMLLSTDGTSYENRTNSLKLKANLGKEPDISIQSMDERDDVAIAFGEKTLSTDVKYMYELLGKRITCLDKICERVGNALLEKNKLTPPQDISKYYLGPIVTYGRIVSDGNGALNAESIMLESPLLGNVRIRLNMQYVQKIAVFPGQIVAVKGKMHHNYNLDVEGINTDITIDLPSKPPVTTDPLRIIFAAGPFTLSTNLDYDPMRTFLNHAIDSKPHVLILAGPFVDENHPLIAHGDISETYDELFQSLIRSILAALRDTNVHHLVIVASKKDAHHHNIFPTPPYAVRDLGSDETKRLGPKVHFCPDPTVLEVDGLRVAIATNDAFYDIAKDEFTSFKEGDAMRRLAAYLIQQQNFYPLYPPSKGANISHELLESFGSLETLPHLMILPSNFRAFVRNIQGCIVVNPEKLTQEEAGGCFADIIVTPGSSLSVAHRVCCKVINI